MQLQVAMNLIESVHKSPLIMKTDNASFGIAISAVQLESRTAASELCVATVMMSLLFNFSPISSPNARQVAFMGAFVREVKVWKA